MERHPKPGSRELVKRLLRRELTCRAAKGELCLDDGIIRRTLECERVGFEEKVRFIHWLGSDIICLTPTYVGSPKQLFRPDESILAEVDLWIQKTDLFVFAILDGAFELGVRTFGFQSFLRQLQRTPSKVKMFVDRVEKNNKNAVSQLAGHGIDGIIIADDIAYKDGLLFRPQAFNELFLPSLARQIECSSSKGVPVFFIRMATIVPSSHLLSRWVSPACTASTKTAGCARTRFFTTMGTPSAYGDILTQRI